MLDKLLSPLTTATSVGVAVRYIATIIGSIVAILGIVGLLSPEQVDALTKQIPELGTAVAALITAIIPIYAIWTKSSSDKAAAAAKKIDEQLPPAARVEIVTPGPGENIIVPGK